MPYIKENKRLELLKKASKGFFIPKEPGELNFLISTLCKFYIEEKGISYKTYNDIIGVLECCKQEIYRRLIAKYEDEKIKENGDIF